MKHESWRMAAKEIPDEIDADFKRKLAVQGVFSIVWLGIFYALTAKTAAWAIWGYTIEWGPILLAGVVMAFARAFDRFMTK